MTMRVWVLPNAMSMRLWVLPNAVLLRVWVMPNASVDRPRPSHTNAGHVFVEMEAGKRGPPEGEVRGRTQRLGRTALQ